MCENTVSHVLKYQYAAAAFFTQTMDVAGTLVKFEIWDTAGQER